MINEVCIMQLLKRIDEYAISMADKIAFKNEYILNKKSNIH